MASGVSRGTPRQSLKQAFGKLKVMVLGPGQCHAWREVELFDACEGERQAHLCGRKDSCTVPSEGTVDAWWMSGSAGPLDNSADRSHGDLG